MNLKSPIQNKNLLTSALGRLLKDYGKAERLLEDCDYKLQEVLYDEDKMKEYLTEDEIMLLKSCFMLVKYSLNTYAYTVKAKKAEDFFNIFRGEFVDEINNERFYVAYLSPTGELKKVKKISEGNHDSTQVYVAKIFEQVPSGTKFIVLCHNHPNGILYPSNDDLIMTRRIKEASKTITLLDHLIVHKNDYYSFVEHNNL